MSSSQSHTAHTVGAHGGDRYLVTDTAVDASRPERPVRVAQIETDTIALSVDLNKTAILVIDMQNDFCAEGGWLHSAGCEMHGMREPIEPINQTTAEMRATGQPVIWLNWGNRPDLHNVPAVVQLPFHQLGRGVGLSCPQPNNRYEARARGSRVLEKDSWGSQVIDELLRESSDIGVDKYRISGFCDSQLDSILRKLGIRTLLFAGVNADQCVMATLMDATFLGYDAVLLRDCVATSSPDFCMDATIYNVRSVFGFVSDSGHVISAIRKA